jgi:hypothetical protein
MVGVSYSVPGIVVSPELLVQASRPDRFTWPHPHLGKPAIASGVPFLPGIANARDIIRGLGIGLSQSRF